MTSPTFPDPAPVSARDDLASAALDDELSAAEQRAFASDPDAVARRDELQELSDLIRRVPPLDDETRRRQRASAVAARGASELTGAGATVAHLRGGRRRTRLPHPAIAAAVVAVLALVGIGLIVGDRGNGDASLEAGGSVTTDADAGQGSTASADEAAPAGRAGDGADDTMASTAEAEADAALPAAGPPDLGDHADQAALTQALAGVSPVDLLPTAAGTTAPTAVAPSTTGAESAGADPTGAADRCDQVVRAIPELELGDRLAFATARLAGRPVVVLSYATPDNPAGSALLVVADTDRCTVEFAVQR